MASSNFHSASLVLSVFNLVMPAVTSGVAGDFCSVSVIVGFVT